MNPKQRSNPSAGSYYQLHQQRWCLILLGNEGGERLGEVIPLGTRREAEKVAALSLVRPDSWILSLYVKIVLNAALVTEEKRYTLPYRENK